MTESSTENNKALENIYSKFSEIMNDRSIIASCLLSPLSEVTNPEKTTQINLVKDSSSNRANDLLLHNTIPVTLYNNFLAFRDTGKEFKVKEDLLKLITNKNYNVDLASLSDKNLMYDFAKEKNFDVKAPSKISNRNRTLKNCLNQLLSWFLDFRKFFNHLILKKNVID